MASKRKLRERVSRLEKRIVLLTLRRHHGNISNASEELGVKRPTLYSLLLKHDLRRSNFA